MMHGAVFIAGGGGNNLYNFVTGPGTAIGYVKDAVSFRAKRHLGHNPAGAVMVIALLLAISAICATGYMMETDTFWGVDWVEEVHEFAANATLVLIALHIGGVVFASIELVHATASLADKW